MSDFSDDDDDLPAIPPQNPHEFYEDDDTALPAPRIDDFEEDLILPNEALDTTIKPKRTRITRKFDVELYARLQWH